MHRCRNICVPWKIWKKPMQSHVLIRRLTEMMEAPTSGPCPKPCKCYIGDERLRTAGFEVAIETTKTQHIYPWLVTWSPHLSSIPFLPFLHNIAERSLLNIDLIGSRHIPSVMAPCVGESEFLWLIALFMQSPTNFSHLMSSPPKHTLRSMVTGAGISQQPVYPTQTFHTHSVPAHGFPFILPGIVQAMPPPRSFLRMC